MKGFVGLALCSMLMLSSSHALTEEEGHHEESPAGASFKAGKGVIMTDETRKNLDVHTAEVSEEKLPQVIRFNVQIFGGKHRFAVAGADHHDREVLGSGLLPPDKAAPVGPGQPVKLVTKNGRTLDGSVIAVKKGVVFGETEIVVGIPQAATQPEDGEFVSATITLPREEPVSVIPRSALLVTAQGTFVYVVNGDAYLRVPVKAGNEADGRVGIVEGLFTGDEVVTRPVEALWLIELRATKGGGHSH